MVFGVRGGGTAAPNFIIGAFPRTRKTSTSSGKFGTLSGFYGSLKKTKTLDGEHNEQIGPATQVLLLLVLKIIIKQLPKNHQSRLHN